MTFHGAPGSRHEPRFVGREAEIREVDRYLTDASVRLVVIAGPRGVGKTTLASQLFTFHRSHSTTFENFIYLPSLGRSIALLLDDIIRTLSFGPPPPYQLADIADVASNLLTGTQARLLLFLDNLEELALTEPLAIAFFRLLAESDCEATILVTTRRWPDDQLLAQQQATVRLLQLGGLSEAGAVLSLIGDSLRYSHSPTELLKVAADLGNVPQRLLYLRWADPSEIGRFVAEYIDKPDVRTLHSLRQVLSNVRGAPLLLLCSVLRVTDYSDEILSHLWFEHRNICTLADAIDELVEQRILTQKEYGQYSLHPDVHHDLGRIAEEKSRLWVTSAHQVCRSYFQQAVSLNRDDLKNYNELVYHSIVLNELNEIILDVFGVNGVTRWRTRGLSLQLEPVLEQLRDAAERSSVLFSQYQRGEIRVALSFLASDLGRPAMALEHLNRGLAELDGLSRSDETNALLRMAWTQMAISHANLGHTSDCIRYYRQVIDSDNRLVEPNTSLCMGYLGYEYCDSMDFESALYWTQRALETCPAERDASVFARNLANRGIVLFYVGQLDDAQAHLEHAVRLVSEPTSEAADVREHGRALSHLAIVRLAQHDTDLSEVSTLLKTSLLLTQRAGDARRTSLTIGRLGLLAAATQDLEESQRLIRLAVINHLNLGDIRNAVFEVLNLCTVHTIMTGNTPSLRPTSILEIALQREPDSEVRSLMHEMWSRAEYGYLIDFWDLYHRNRYFPKLRYEE